MEPLKNIQGIQNKAEKKRTKNEWTRREQNSKVIDSNVIIPHYHTGYRCFKYSQLKDRYYRIG